MATDLEDVLETIETEFMTQWEATVGKTTIPIQAANVQKPAGTGKRKVSNLTQFVTYNVFIPDSIQSEMSVNPGTRITGFIQFGSFIKSGSGTRLAWRAIDDAKVIFEKKTINGITFRTGSLSGSIEGDGFHQLVFDIPFFAFLP